MYGCDSWEVSCSRTVAAAEGAPPEHAAVLVAHNGPAGLGTHAAAVCGADFLAGGGDWGDVDLRSALDTLHRKGRCAPPGNARQLRAACLAGGPESVSQPGNCRHFCYFKCNCEIHVPCPQEPRQLRRDETHACVLCYRKQ